MLRPPIDCLLYRKTILTRLNDSYSACYEFYKTDQNYGLKKMWIIYYRLLGQYL